MSDYAVAMTFPTNATTYEAFSKFSGAQDGFGVRAAALVERDESGLLKVPEEKHLHFGAGYAEGAVIGLLVGVLGGPVGMLLGWGVGATAGALVDVHRFERGTEAIAEFGGIVPPGGNAILAETTEPDTAALDSFVAGLGGTILRRTREEVVGELEAQQEATEQAHRAARKAIHEDKSRERHENLEHRVAALKARLHKD
jgi:uncharacterized membrane protein